MKKLILLSFIFLLLASLGLSEEKKIGSRRYLISVPSGEGPHPVMMWFHGGGMRAETQFQQWTATGLVDKVIFVAPQSKDILWSKENDGSFVDAVFKEVHREHDTIEGASLLGGFSSGAVFAYVHGLSHQGDYSEIIIASGVLQGKVNVAGSKASRFSLYHSTNDDVFKYSDSKSALKKLEENGYTVTLSSDTVGHDLSRKMFDDFPQILERAIEGIGGEEVEPGEGDQGNTGGLVTAATSATNSGAGSLVLGSARVVTSSGGGGGGGCLLR